MIQTILSILAAALSLYTLLCFIYILMSWFPGAKFTKFGHVMSAICEPYMNLFRKMSFLRIGNIDFFRLFLLEFFHLHRQFFQAFREQVPFSLAGLSVQL